MNCLLKAINFDVIFSIKKTDVNGEILAWMTYRVIGLVSFEHQGI